MPVLYSCIVNECRRITATIWYNQGQGDLKPKMEVENTAENLVLARSERGEGVSPREWYFSLPLAALGRATYQKFQRGSWWDLTF